MSKMGAFGVTRKILREEIADLVGVRVGLAVGFPRIDQVIDATLSDIGPADDDGRRLHSTEFAQLSFAALAAFGDPWTELGYHPVVTEYFRLPEAGRDNLAHRVLAEIHRQVHLDRAYKDLHAGPCAQPDDLPAYDGLDTFVHHADLAQIDEDELVSRVQRMLGSQGRDACLTLLRATKARQRMDPWFKVRRAKIDSIASLNDLFEGGRWVPPGDDAYFDQRFIDYLVVNLTDVPRIHWRQFERLTAEYFHRRGYLVELGPGRGDDGVDLRVWPQDTSTLQPPLIIVQCKRQRAKVSKAVVKALWADVHAERAERGLIVTSSWLEPGAAKTIDVRGYGVEVADRDAVSQWLMELRTPGTGTTSLQRDIKPE